MGKDLSTLKNNSIIIENKTNFRIPDELFYPVLKVVFEEEKISKDKTVGIVLTTDEIIRKYNKKYLGRDSITDVMSFQVDDPGLPYLGDIMIDIEVAEKQKGNNNLNEELQILFLHGLLHLLGYDHISIAQKKNMEIKEKKYWKKIKEEK